MKKYISFSGGVESTTLCVLLGNSCDAIFSDTGFEFDELYERIDFVQDEIRKLHNNNFTIHKVKNKDHDSLPDYIQKSNYYPSYGQRFCTRMFKIEPIDYYLKQFEEVEIVIGLNADEQELRTGNHGNLKHVTYSYYLADNGINRVMCESILNSVNLHPNFPVYMKRGGCVGCYYKSKPEIKAMYFLKRPAYDYLQKIEEGIQDERGKMFYIFGNLGMSLRSFRMKLETQKELFDEKDFYAVINNATKCGVFCNR